MWLFLVAFHQIGIIRGDIKNVHLYGAQGIVTLDVPKNKNIIVIPDSAPMNIVDEYNISIFETTKTYVFQTNRDFDYLYPKEYGYDEKNIEILKGDYQTIKNVKGILRIKGPSLNAERFLIKIEGEEPYFAASTQYQSKHIGSLVTAIVLYVLFCILLVVLVKFYGKFDFKVDYFAEATFLPEEGLEKTAILRDCETGIFIVKEDANNVDSNAENADNVENQSEEV